MKFITCIFYLTIAGLIWKWTRNDGDTDSELAALKSEAINRGYATVNPKTGKFEWIETPEQLLQKDKVHFERRQRGQARANL